MLPLLEIPRRYPYRLAGISGVVMGLTPAPVNAWPLAWVALVPLWVLIRHPPQKLRRAIALGLTWGLGYHGTALSWITGLHPLTWMGIPWLTSLAIALACWVFITLWGAMMIAAWAGLTAQLPPQLGPGGRVLVGTTLWCGLEWLWTQSPLWWTALSYTQSPSNLAILHLGQLSGPITVTAALVAVNGLIAEGVGSGRRRWRYGSGAIALLVGCHLLGWGLYLQPLTAPADMALKVGIIQGNVPTRIKLYEEGLRRGRRAYLEGYQQLAEQGAEAVLMPEGAFPLTWQASTLKSHPLFEAVQEQGAIAWFGMFLPTGERITQSLVALTPEGILEHRYHKVKLVPLGEYIPFEQTLGRLIGRLSPISANMLPGESNQQFETPFGRAIVGICYDSAFPHLFQLQAAAGGQFILTAANNDPYSGRMMAQHHAHDVMRAIETDRWAVRATNTGLSGVVDPHGRTRWLSRIQTYEVHAHTIYRRQTLTLYVAWGNWLLPGLIGLSLVVTVRQRIGLGG